MAQGFVSRLMGVGIPDLQAKQVLTDITTTEASLPFAVSGSQVYVKAVALGALPNNTSAATAHGITGLNQIIAVWGWAEHSSNGSRRAIPIYDADSTGHIEIRADGTNLTVQTAADQSAFSATVYVLYTKD